MTLVKKKRTCVCVYIYKYEKVYIHRYIYMYTWACIHVRISNAYYDSMISFLFFFCSDKFGLVNSSRHGGIKNVPPFRCTITHGGTFLDPPLRFHHHSRTHVAAVGLFESISYNNNKFNRIIIIPLYFCIM